jgi:transcription elongation factor Elf1
MEITACPVCGSRNIGIGTLGDGIISGLSSWNEVCRDCGYQGASLVFDSESEYNKFLEALAHQKQQADARSEDSKEMELGENSDESPSVRSGKKSYLFELIISVVLTSVFFIILTGSNFLGGFTNLISLNTLWFPIVSLIGSFVGVLLFFFLLIVLGETLYRSIRGGRK